MTFVRRVLGVGAVGVVALSLSACGGSSTTEATGDTIARLDTPNFVTVPPVTLAPTSTAPPASVAAGRVEGSQTYTVQGGDSVSKIAAQFDITMDQLVEFNSWSDGVGHPLFAGDVIEIPPGASQANASDDDADDDSGETASDDTSDDATDTGDDAAGSDEGCVHTIEAGDNPTKVASQYNIPVQALTEANQGTGVLENFLIGDELQIPAGADCS